MDRSGYFRDRVHPTGTPARIDGWWDVTDSSSAERAVSDMAARMESEGWDALDALLSRARMLEAVRAGDLGFLKLEKLEAFSACAEAVLIMDDGPSDELEACLARALEGATPRQRENAQKFDAWVRSQASREIA